jgi:prevent-host-death family protein
MEVSVREFKSHLSSYLARAQAGEDVVVTSHNRPVARVSGLTAGLSPGIAALLASGQAEWHGGKPAGARIKLVIEGKSLSDMVIEDRG